MTGIPRRALELIYKTKRPTGRSRMRWFSHVLEVLVKRGKSLQEMKEEQMWEERRCSPIQFPLALLWI
jgi:hypothetical protein